MRKLAISAAALVVTVLPTACDYAYASSGNSSVSTPAGGSGHSGHSAEGGQNHGGNPGQAPDDNNSEGSGDNNGGNGGQDGDNNGDSGQNENGQGGNNNGDNGQGDNGQGGDNNGNDNGGDNNGGGGNGQGDNGQGNNGQGNNGQGNNGQDDNGQGDNGDEQPPAENNGLDVLGRDCTESKLQPHDGFQLAPRCVSTAFGEVASEDKSPSLLITDSPRSVRANEKFTISVSTRNLVRDRFLGAAAGGYYLESSFLNEDGLQRGHFHTACRMLETTDTAPDAAPAPEFFLATQDNGGGAEPDTVKITVTGMPTAGTAQCAVWAGDGSHRIPMMQRADQTPAFDAVRITVE
ncbi:hypothetical protein ACQPZQ_44440 [Pseudonocardia sp. CA-142604]|uniref:hypothetical protein n=1 Tax=Pseudonocardia sp. CA-142604 TaxID=3240024 RepID=UPI003D9039C8